MLCYHKLQSDTDKRVPESRYNQTYKVVSQVGLGVSLYKTMRLTLGWDFVEKWTVHEPLSFIVL